MTKRTRYFVIASLLTLGVGIGTGLVAYFGGLPTSAFSSQGGAGELKYVPRDAAVVGAQRVLRGLRQQHRRSFPHGRLPS